MYNSTKVKNHTHQPLHKNHQKAHAERNLQFRSEHH